MIRDNESRPGASREALAKADGGASVDLPAAALAARAAMAIRRQQALQPNRADEIDVAP
jgi:hypothetical protein